MTRKRVLVAAVALVIGVLVGGIIGYAIPRADAPESVAYPTNSFGLSYGEVGLTPPPDLVAVTTDDGIDGYVFELQLNGRPPTGGVTPESVTRTPIPVYDLELENVLGYTTAD